MSVLNNGNVGIGTSSPWAQLSINPNGITGPAFVIGSSSITNFVVTNSGNVGIGTESPGALLHVNNQSLMGAGTALLRSYSQLELTRSGDPYLELRNLNAASLGNGGFIDFNAKDNGGTEQTIAQFGGQTDATHATAPGGRLVFFTTAAGSVAAVERMRIDSAGNVGIGTTSPYAKLSVNGQVVGSYFTATSTSATSTFPYLTVTQTNLGTVVGGLWNGTAISNVYGGTGQNSSSWTGFASFSSRNLVSFNNSLLSLWRNTAKLLRLEWHSSHRQWSLVSFLKLNSLPGRNRSN